jgi:hypothetical protein
MRREPAVTAMAAEDERPQTRFDGASRLGEGE